MHMHQHVAEKNNATATLPQRHTGLQAWDKAKQHFPQQTRGINIAAGTYVPPLFICVVSSSGDGNIFQPNPY